MQQQAIRELLVELVSLDHTIKELNEKIAECEQQISQHTLQLEQAATTLEEHKTQRIDQQKKIDSIELDIKEIDTNEKKKKEASEKITNKKEYDAIKKELAILSAARQDKEDQLVSTWHNLELIDKKLKTEEENYATHIEELKQKIAALQEEISNLEHQKKEIFQKQDEKISSIPPDWLAKYKRMKGKVSDPIVPVHEGSCSSCYYLILPQDLAKIKKGEMLPCRNCYRFLYYDKEEEKTANEASF